MTKLILRRIGVSIPVVVMATLIVFAFTSMVPGDPATTLAGEFASPEQIAAIRERLGLDRPFLVQYWDWLTGIMTGDFGSSLYNDRPVLSSIAERLPVTVSVTVCAMVVALLVAVPAGIMSALRRGSGIDSGLSVLASLGLALPSFWLGAMLVYVFAISLGVLPAIGYVGIVDNPVEWAKHMVLPAVTLGTAAAAETTRQLRAAMVDVLQQDYIRTARAGGLSAKAIVLKYALKNGATPVVTVLGFQLAFLLGGSVVVEQVFALPGLGSLAIRAVLDGDIPMIQGIVLFATLVVVAVNLVVDVVYGWLNPKVRVA